MDDHVRKKLIEIKAVSLELMSPYVRTPLAWTAYKDPVYELLNKQTALIDSLLDEELNGSAMPVLILVTE